MFSVFSVSLPIFLTLMLTTQALLGDLLDWKPGETFPAPSFSLLVSAASGSGAVGAASGLPITDASADATGTAGYGAILDSNGVVKWTGTVTATSGGGDFEIDNTSITAGQEVQLTTFNWTLPQGT